MPDSDAGVSTDELMADPTVSLAMKYARLLGHVQGLIGRAIAEDCVDEHWMQQARIWKRWLATADRVFRESIAPGPEVADTRFDATRRAAEAAGLKALDEDQLTGLACVQCGRTTRGMRPIEGWYGGRQLFVCADSVACAAAAEQRPPGAPSWPPPKPAE